LPEVFGFDAFSPKEIAEKVERIGVVKARLPLLSMTMLGVIAGGFIAAGGLYYTLLLSDHTIPFAVARLLGGLAFSLGLVLVTIAGAELFTGNNLLTIAWADGKISTREMLRNWLVIAAANLAGAMGMAVLVLLAGQADMNKGLVGDEYVKIAAAKCALPFWTAFWRGVLCNMLVCIAVWMALAGRSVIDKVVAIVFPISAFVAAGFEHCVANMFFIPMGLLLKSAGVQGAEGITWAGFGGNLAAVVLGNIVGGYQIIYRRNAVAHVELGGLGDDDDEFERAS
jgi:formate/nitrite transporter